MSAEKVSKRRGRAVKRGIGKPAVFKSGRAAPPTTFDPEWIASLINIYWENGAGRTFLLCDEETGDWSSWSEDKVRALLIDKWVQSRRRDGDSLSEIARTLLHVMRNRRLEQSLNAIAGYPSGVHTIDGKRFLVRNGPRLTVPIQGNWATLKALINAKLDLSSAGGPNQTTYFHGWLKIALEALHRGGPGNFRPGQCCIFAGPRDSGKSRLQHQVITALLGGRSADPGPYLFGRTDFNGEMFSAEHLMMEDPASSTATKERVFFGEMLKQLIVNDTQRLHRKREEALVVSPFWRLTISINDDPDKMRVLPIFTPDIRDKIHLFRVAAGPMPMPTGTLQQRQMFRNQIGFELPAYAWWLMHEFEIPKSLQSERFGISAWLNPDLLFELAEDAPASTLLEIIDAAHFSIDGRPGLRLWDIPSKAECEMAWEGTALELERLLLNERDWSGCTYADRAKRLLAKNRIDRLLARLKEDQPERVSRHRVAEARRWVVKRRL